MVVSLEPTEALRVLRDYGNPDVKVICNMRPIHAVGVISGEMEYPSHEDLKKWIQTLSTKAWFVNATDEAMKLGNPIFREHHAGGCPHGNGNASTGSRWV